MTVNSAKALEAFAAHCIAGPILCEECLVYLARLDFV
jgi:hypothetical protein